MTLHHHFFVECWCGWWEDATSEEECKQAGDRHQSETRHTEPSIEVF